MPKVEIDYSNTIIYKIACKDPLISHVYVGHTTNFVQRKYAHKQTCNNIKSPCYNLTLYKTIRSNGNWSNWEMTIINFYNCKDQFEARQKEQEHFVILKATLNSVEPLPMKINLPSQPKLPHMVDKVIFNNKKFECDLCDLKCSKKSDFDRHLLTQKHKHKQLLNPDTNGAKSAGKIFLCYCGKEYKHRQSLSVHKKTCQILPEKEKNANAKTEIITGLSEEFIMKLINQNNDMQKLILEQNTKMTDQNAKIIELISTQVQSNNAVTKDTKHTTKNTVNNNNNNNNTTNNNFNLQIFLNETCKDALNLTDFVSSLQVKLKDLEETAKLGYTNGVSRIFINGLNDLEENMRPIHCSDLKRETLYIKNDDKWTKEGSDKSVITKAIKKVSNKNIQQIFEWQKKYPEYKDPESKQNDKYLEMLSGAMGGSTDEEQFNNLDKIIRNITKEVVINKT